MDKNLEKLYAVPKVGELAYLNSTRTTYFIPGNIVKDSEGSFELSAFTDTEVWEPHTMEVFPDYERVYPGFRHQSRGDIFSPNKTFPNDRTFPTTEFAYLPATDVYIRDGDFWTKM